MLFPLIFLDLQSFQTIGEIDHLFRHARYA